MTSPEQSELLDRIRAAGGDSEVRDQVQIKLLDWMTACCRGKHCNCCVFQRPPSECCISVLLLFKRRGGKRTRAQTERQSPQCSVLRDLLWFCPLRVSRPDAKRVWLGRTVLPPEQTADGLKGKHLEQGKTVLSLSLSLSLSVCLSLSLSACFLLLLLQFFGSCFIPSQPSSHCSFLLFPTTFDSSPSISLWQPLSHLFSFFSVWLHLTFFLFSVFYVFFSSSPTLSCDSSVLPPFISSPLLQPLLFCFYIWFSWRFFLVRCSLFITFRSFLSTSYSFFLSLLLSSHAFPIFFPSVYKRPSNKIPSGFSQSVFPLPPFFLFHLPTSNSCFSFPFFFQSSSFSLLISSLFSANPTYVASPRSLPPFSSYWPIFFVSIRHLVWFIPFSRRSPADRSAPVSTLSSLFSCRGTLSSLLLLHRFHLYHLIVRLLSPSLYHIFDISSFSLASSFTHSNFFPPHSTCHLLLTPVFSF